MRAEVADCLAIAALKLAVSLAVLAAGFHAVSDDDFARVVIAQEWVASPALDPSGTSWLPFPFWVNGVAMLGLGRSFEVARAVALVLSLFGAIGVYVSARWLHVERTGALVGALIACCIPYSAWLGVATVPDGPTAAFIVLGAASLGRAEPRVRFAGAGLLLAATLSRYEAWPVAAVFAVLTVWDALRDHWSGTDGARSERGGEPTHRGRSLALVGAAMVAAAGPLSWVMHGVARHGDAFFFVARVSAYRAAVGGTPASWLVAMLGYPVAILRCEPELIAVTAITLITAWRTRASLDVKRYVRFGVALLALVLFLVVGELRNTAPTHHAERAVLAVWLALAILTGDVGVRALKQRAHPRCTVSSSESSTPPFSRALWVSGAAMVVALLLAGFIARPWFARIDDFADRRSELALGRDCRARAAAEERLLIDTADFGFFAVMAGFESVEYAAPLDDRDPRKKDADDPFADAERLTERLHREGATWLVVTSDHREVAGAVGDEVTRRAELTLLKL